MKFISLLSLVVFVVKLICLPIEFPPQIPQENKVLLTLQKYYEEEKYEAVTSFCAQNNCDELMKNERCEDKALMNSLIAKSFYNLNNESTAVVYFKKSLAEGWHNCQKKDTIQCINTYYNIAMASKYTLDYMQGLTYLDTAIYLIGKVKTFPKSEYFYKYQGAGSFYAKTKEFLLAEKAFELSYQYHKYADDPVDVYYLLIEQLSLYNKFKKHTSARKIVGLIQTKFINNTTLSEVDKALFYLNLAELELHSKNYEQSEFYCSKVLSNLDKSEIDLLSNAHEILGLIQLQQNKYTKSKFHYNQAYLLRQKSGNIDDAKSALAFSYENLAEIEHLNSNSKKAIFFIDKAINILTADLTKDQDSLPILNIDIVNHPFHLQRLLTIKQKFLLSSKTINHNLVTKIFFKVDTLLDINLENAYFDESKIELLNILDKNNKVAGNYYYAKYLKNPNNSIIDTILYFSSRSKSLILYQSIINTEKSTQEKVLHDSLENLRNKIIQTQSAIINNNSLKDSLSFILLSYKNAFISLKRSFAKNTNIIEIKVSDLQNIVNSDEMLLEFFQLDSSLLVLYISKYNVEIKSIHSSDLEEEVEKVRKNLLDPFSKYTYAECNILRNWFFTTPENTIQNFRKLIICPSSLLIGIPFEALLDENNSFLIQNYSFRYVYSVSMLLENNVPEKRKYKYDIVAYATGYSDKLKQNLLVKGFKEEATNVSNFPNSKKELSRIISGFDAKVFEGKNATKNNYLKNADAGFITYLSLHGIVEKDIGMYSSLIFDDNHNDFILRAFEIEQIPNCSPVVILNSCHSADGELNEFEGLVGITRTLIKSGTETVLSSVWPAFEINSADILHYFLQNIKSSESYGQALQKAKITYLSNAAPQQKHPFYWANFILIGSEGDQASMHQLSTNHSTHFWFVFIVLITVIILYSTRKVIKNYLSFDKSK